MFVLLDIDGVLVTTPGWRSAELHSDGFLKFDDRAASNLARLIQTTEASIILTSTHRIRYSSKQWKALFNARGIPVTDLQKIDDANAIEQVQNRCSDILKWLGKSETVDRYVILDDDASLHALPPRIKDRWVMIRPMTGLDDESIENAIQLLRYP